MTTRSGGGKQSNPMDAAVRSFLRHLRLDQNYSPETLRAYASDLVEFTAYLNKDVATPVKPGRVDRVMVRGFLAELHRKGSKRSTIARKLSAVRSLFRYMKRRRIIHENPAAVVGTPRQEHRLPRQLSVDEMKHLVETPDDSTPLGSRDRAIMELLYATGVRVSELTAVDFDDLDLSDGMMRVRGKGKKERLVPVGSKA